MQNREFRMRRKKDSPGLITGPEFAKKSLIACGTSLISYTLLMTGKYDNLRVYMDEMLHSIFFLAYIFDSSLTPSKFFQIPKVRDYVMQKFPEPFRKYNSHLPSRTPFSILLTMMEILHCTENEILDELLKILRELKFPEKLHKSGNPSQQFYTLESRVICVCYSDSDSDSKKYYGASLSCSKANAKEILINLSCLHVWHKYISHAVMSFRPKDNATGDATGDGTGDGTGDSITFPESVKCQAYTRDWTNYVYIKKVPCLICKKLFNLKSTEKKEPMHPIGNCAETESFSKLLHGNQYIKEETIIENYSEENLKKLRDLTKDRLINELGKVGIQINNDTFLFYNPMK